MSDALMEQLRESLLLERARKIYSITYSAVRTKTDAIDLIRDVLRITREEGIAVGLDQATRHAQQIEAVA